MTSLNRRFVGLGTLVLGVLMTFASVALAYNQAQALAKCQEADGWEADAYQAFVDVQNYFYNTENDFGYLWTDYQSVKEMFTPQEQTDIELLFLAASTQLNTATVFIWTQGSPDWNAETCYNVGYDSMYDILFGAWAWYGRGDWNTAYIKADIALNNNFMVSVARSEYADDCLNTAYQRFADIAAYLYP